MDKEEDKFIVVYDKTDDKDHSPTAPRMTDAEKRAFKLRNYRLTMVGEILPTNYIKLGIAVCSGKDIFKRTIGKEKAKERMESSPILVMFSDTDCKNDREKRVKATRIVRSFGIQIRKALSARKRHGDVVSYLKSSINAL